MSAKMQTIRVADIVAKTLFFSFKRFSIIALLHIQNIFEMSARVIFVLTRCQAQGKKKKKYIEFVMSGIVILASGRVFVAY